MRISLRNFGLGASYVLPIAMAGPALAANGTVTVTALTATTNLGKVAAAATGQTVFTVNNAGAISRTSGTGVRITTGSTTAITVTVRCTSGPCANGGNGKITAVGTPAGRAGTLTNFTPVSGTATLTSISGTSTVTFSFPASIPNNTNRTFTMGLDFPILGNDSISGTPSVTSTSQFSVAVASASTIPNSAMTGTATATVFRGMAMTKTSDLAFGTIIKPSGVAGTVTISNTGGTVTVGGAGYAKMPSGRPATTPSSAQFLISGEAAQAYTLAVPASFTMTGPGTNSLVVTLSPTTASGTQTFSGSAGAASTLTLGVGGSFGVAAAAAYGAYSGTFVVTATYN